MNDKECECSENSALYNDFWIIRCQYCCWKIMDEKRVAEYIEYNTSNKE